MKSLLNSTEKKRLLSNFFSLSVLQGANYILPLITFPYLVRVLGVEKYGLIAFAGAFITYFNILTDYGFNLTATREISIYRGNKEKLEEIFSSVMIIKFILMIISFFIMSLIVFSFSKFRNDYLVYFLTFGMVIGQVLFPQWFFQGIERMKYITFLNILAKVIFTLAIFIFIHNTNDYLYVPLLNSLGFIITGIFALWIVFRNFKIKFKFQSFDIIKYYFVDGWHLFLSQISVAFFNNTNVLILGIFTSNLIVGYYAIAEKLMRILARMQTPITNSLYPYIAKLIKIDTSKAFRILCNVLVIGSMLYTIGILLILLILPFLLSIIIKNDYQNIVEVFKIICMVPLFVFINNIFGTQLMLNLNMKKEFTKIIINGAITNALLSLILTYKYSLYGTSFALLITEFYIMIAMWYKVKGDFKCLKKLV